MSWFDKAYTRSSILGVLGLLLAVTGCAEERAPINRVQPNALDKTFFVGKDLADPTDDPEFYAQATLVDVGYGAEQSGLFTSTYTQQLARLKWTIQEDQLIGRITHERIQGSDGKGVGPGPSGREGLIAAIFKIEKHFDIQRAYNSTTGEELNVIEENSSDRPWNERKFMRVDWSKNLNTDSYDFGTLSLLGIYGSIKYEPTSYYVNDPYHRDAPLFATEQGYFDVTTKVFAEPQQLDLSSYGWGIDSFPACFLPADFAGGTGPTANCNPVEMTIRHSFRQVPNNDYEPLDMGGYDFQAFGAFLTERNGYARNYGMTDDRLHRFVNRYNIWKRSHYYADPVRMTGAVECFTPETTRAGENANRDEKPHDGTADECAAVGRGSQCDIFSQKCTLPYRDREIQPQPWYYTSGSNLEYFESTKWATQEWDTAMRMAVMAARYAECTSTWDPSDKDQESCTSKFPTYFGQQDENDDAIALSKEVDACLEGKAYLEFAGRCDQVADAIGADRGYSAGVIAVAKMERIIVLCHSPVQADDPAQCGGPRLPVGLTAQMCDDAEVKGDRATLARCDKALRARIGDLRYHQINVLKAPQTPSPWGIMVDSHDPLTGEKVAASINVWSHVTDLATQGLVDLSRYAAGDLKTEDVTEGTFVRDWSQVAEAAGKGGGALAPMTAEQLDERLASIVGVTPEKFRAADVSRYPPSVRSMVRETTAELRGVRAEFSAPSSNRPIYEARRKAAVGTALEAELTTKAMQQFAGLTKGLAQSPMAVTMASPFQGTNPALNREMRNLKQNALAERGICMMHNEAPAPVSIASLAKHLQRKFGDFSAATNKHDKLERAETMRKYLAQRFNYAVIAHEMGHSIGLRHNFVSSSDAWGYRPQYWQLRTRDGERNVACKSLNEPEDCIGPRYFDPVSDEQGEQLIQMFMHSTVMDYPGELTQDMVGLAAYDFAATRFFYGNTVSVFQDASYEVGNPRAVGMLDKTDNMGGTSGIKPSITQDNDDPNEASPFHYSQIQNVFQVIQDCRPIVPEKFKPALWNEERDGQWDPLLDGLLVTVDGTYTRCKQQPVDYVRWSSLRMPNAREIAGYNGGPAVDPYNRVRVPYGFATDRWADLGNLSVFRHDNGADPYELFDFLITQQEMNHIFDNYRRNRFTFSVRNAANRTLSRYNEKLRDAAKGLGIQVNFFRDLAGQVGYDPAGLWAAVVKQNRWDENLLAAGLAFDHFSRQLARPQIGPHEYTTFNNRIVDPVLRSANSVSTRTQALIPNGATGTFGNVGYGGKLVNNTFADNKGEFDVEFIQNAGSYYDKAWTAMLMTESVDNFVSSSRNDFTDARYRAVSLADLFPEGYRRWLATNLTGDDELKGVRLAMNPGGKIDNATDGFPTHGIGWTSWWQAGGPQTCFSEKMSLLCSTNTANTVAVDPQIGWEQQKFLIAWTLLYLPENQKQVWLNQMRLWQLGYDSDPGFENRIEFHDPYGMIYVAKTYGKETIFGKRVQKGIAARVLEWANVLTKDAFLTKDGPDLDGDGTPDWYEPVFGSDGQPMVKYDPTMIWMDDEFRNIPAPAGCNENDISQCVCEMNRACLKLRDYSEVPFFLRQALYTYSFGDLSMKGIY